MKVIGLTGGIGAGKSTAASILKELGAYIIDADIIASQAVEKGTETLKEITNYFGNNILDTYGQLDRKKLGGIVFNNPEKLNKLNEIVHKEVYSQIENKLSHLSKEGYEGIVVVDVPVPSERFKRLVEQVWVIDADTDIRVSRIMKRNGFSQEEAIIRINAQMSRKEYIDMADIVIKNNGTIDELYEQIKKLFLQQGCQS